MEEGRCAFKMLTSEPTGKRRLERPRRRWMDSIREDLKEIGINARNWVDSFQDRDYWRVLVNASLNLQVSQALKLVIFPLQVFEEFLVRHILRTLLHILLSNVLQT